MIFVATVLVSRSDIGVTFQCQHWCQFLIDYLNRTFAKKLHTGLNHDIIYATPMLCADLDLLFMHCRKQPNLHLPTMFSSISQGLKDKRLLVMKLHTNIHLDIFCAVPVC